MLQDFGTFLKFPFPDSVQDDVAVYFEARELASSVRKAFLHTKNSYSFHDVFAMSTQEQACSWAISALRLPAVTGPTHLYLGILALGDEGGHDRRKNSRHFHGSLGYGVMLKYPPLPQCHYP